VTGPNRAARQHFACGARRVLVAGAGRLYMMGMKRFIPFLKSKPSVAVVRLQGVIAAGGRGGALSGASLGPLLERAFRKGKPQAVALVINSPGGSPVQSALIGAHIRRLSVEHKMPVHAFVEDVAASGGYWLACAADDIYVDTSSIVGSIGVISASFGFHDLMVRNGIERRVYTAGKDKSMLDPFRPEREEDVVRLKELQVQIHDAFITHVKARRADKLSDDQDLFTGEIWVGQRAIDVGLVDDIGHLEPVMKARYGKDVRFIRHGVRRPFLQRLGVSALDQVWGAVDDRALWARFGL
jgi:serine protease SohB